MNWKERLSHPVTALGVGLAVFPLAKVLYIPNYVFNFLTTLVHEIGHSVCAWLMGMPSIPTVSVAGGGVTVWGEQNRLICVAVLAGLLALAWRFRRQWMVLVPLGLAILVYPFLAFSRHHEILAIAGGVLFEIGGAVACFVVVIGVQLKRPIERPLYALWGWWMLLNRGAETVLMIRSPGYRESQAIINSGLAAGLTSDLQTLSDRLNTAPTTVLWIVLFIAIASLPLAIGLGVLWRRISPTQSEED